MNDKISCVLLATNNGNVLLPCIAVAEIISYIKPINGKIIWRDSSIKLEHETQAKYIAVLYNNNGFIAKTLAALPKVMTVSESDLQDLDDVVVGY